MSSTSRLFSTGARHIYDTGDRLFTDAMRENVTYHCKNCNEYRQILSERGYSPDRIKSFDDLAELPFLTTLYLKRHKLTSLPDKKLIIKATSSGTSGSRSLVGCDLKSLMLGKDMVINVGLYHRLWSARPANYLIFGYEISKTNTTAVSKTAYGFTFFAPAAHREYAIKTEADGFTLSWDSVLAALERYSASPFPMRTIGFPSYTFFLLEHMEKNGIRFKMPKGSLLTVGGGWKQFYTQKPDKRRFYELAKEHLGIDENCIVEFFGAVEHPILYTDCRCHHFHIPVYSRVIIRDPDTLIPVKNGEVGIVDLLTPMMHGCPLSSIVTDDLGVIHDEPCPCGAKSPWLEIIGRVGVSGIVTCAAGAETLLKGENV